MSAVDRFLVTFPGIVFEAMPFIILGALISGALEELLPQRWVTRIIPKRRGLAVGASALLGLAFPMCECGIVPVMRRLLKKGLPLSCAVAYMLAAPIINPVVIASTWAAFYGDRSGLDGLSSLQMVLLRCSMAFVVAFAVGMIVGIIERKRGTHALVRTDVHHLPDHDHHHQDHSQDHSHHEHAHAEETEALVELPVVHDEAAEPELQRKTIGQRLTSISETALHDFIDIACFLILGAVLASLVRVAGFMENTPGLVNNPVVASLSMMLLAVLLCLCSEADAFVAANLIEMPLTGKLAFLVLGPMVDLKLFFMYTRVFRYRLIWTVMGSVAVCVFVLSLAAPYIDEAVRQVWQQIGPISTP